MATITPLSILGTAAAGGGNTPAAPELTVLGFASQNANATSGKQNSGGLFGVLAGANAGSAIQNILNSQQTQQSRTAFFDNVANYIKALQTGQLQITATSPAWQTDAAYLQQTGQPFVVTTDSKGNVQVDPEQQADLSRFSPAQQSILARALDTVSTMAQKIQANATNQRWLDLLTNVEPTLTAIRTGFATPAADWQRQAASLAATGAPFKVALDAKGNVIVENQLQGNFSGVPASEQATLANAVAQLQTALQTGIVHNAWEAQALTDVQQGQDYYLDIAPVTGNIVVKTNSPQNIIPDFLKTPPYPDIGAKTPWLQQAANFIQQGTGYYLDIAGNGQIIVRQNNGAGINTWNQPQQQAAQNAIVNLLA